MSCHVKVRRQHTGGGVDVMASQAGFYAVVQVVQALCLHGNRRQNKKKEVYAKRHLEQRTNTGTRYPAGSRPAVVAFPVQTPAILLQES